jgi:hypothetical protein
VTGDELNCFLEINIVTKPSKSEDAAGGIVIVHCHVRGIVPTIHGNGQMADPANRFAQEALEIRKSKKRGGVLSDQEQDRLYKALFMGQLYLKDRKDMTVPCYPGENIEAMIRGGAKKSKGGTDALIGMSVVDDFPLIYDGPSSAEELWADERFRFFSMPMPRGGGARTVNCRCRFWPWEIKFEVMLDTQFVNPETLRKWLEDAGRQVGLSAWHPKYGRFIVVSVE